jgi:hypothetical protein
MVWVFDCLGAPERFRCEMVPRLIEAYDATAVTRLTTTERRALAPYTAAVPLFYAALDGFTEDPPGMPRARVRSLRLSEWLLTDPKAPPPCDAHGSSTHGEDTPTSAGARNPDPPNWAYFDGGNRPLP